MFKKSLKASLLLAGFVALFAAGFALAALIIMVIWGALAGYFDFQTIPYGIAFIIALALSVIGSVFRGGSK